MSSEHIAVYAYIASRSIGKLVATIFVIDRQRAVCNAHIAVYYNNTSGNTGKFATTIFCQRVIESSEHATDYIQ